MTTELALLANFLASVVVAVSAARFGRMRFSDPVFWYTLFHFFVFVIRPAFVLPGEYRFVYDYIGFYPSSGDQLLALYAALLGYCAFCFGAVLHTGLTRVDSLPMGRGTIDRHVFAPNLTKYTFLLLLPPALYSVMHTMGGVSFDGSTSIEMIRINGIAVNVNSNGYLNELRNILPSLALLLYVSTKRSLMALLFLALFIAYRLYIGWGRFNLVMLGFGLLLIEYYIYGKNIARPKYLILGLFITTIFVLLGENRDLFRNMLDSGAGVASTYSTDRRFLEGLDFANFEYLTYIVAVIPEQSGSYNFGLQYLQLFTEPIPRALWSSKPVGPPIENYSLMDYGNWIGLTQSLVGDAWQNGGSFGVAITMSIWGWALTNVYFRFVNSSNFSRATWLILVPYLLQMYRDGGVVTISKFIFFSSLPFMVYALLSKTRRSGSIYKLS